MKKDQGKGQSRLVARSAIVIGLAIMGDSLMYTLLPLEASKLGIPLVFVGALLSVNRIVRLVTNTLTGLIFERYGARRPFIWASIIALITTAVYGLGWGVAAFFLARAGWGMAWSLFRQGGFEAVWAGGEEQSGRMMGLLWGLVGLGAAISVVVGGFIYDHYGYAIAIAAVTGITALSIPAAIGMRWPQGKQASKSPASRKGWQSAFNSRRKRWLLGAAFSETFFEGILISTASLFLAFTLLEGQTRFGLAAGTAAGFLLALRFSANILFGPLIGAISDRLGQRATLSVLSLVILIALVGVVLFEGVWLLIGLALVFIASGGLSITANAAASEIGFESERPHLFVGFYNTAKDTGSALGPLFAYSSTAILGALGSIYLVSASLLFVMVQGYVRVAKKKAA